MGKYVFINPSGNQIGMFSKNSLKFHFFIFSFFSEKLSNFFKNDICVEEVDMITNEEIQYVNNIS